MTKSFVPLECNPEVFNAFLDKLNVKNLEFADVYSLDEDTLAFVPRPVLALILVFPTSEAYEAYRTQADANAPIYTGGKDPALWAPQTIRNSCGTMALIHALANGVPAADLGNGLAATLVEKLTPLDVEQRGKYLDSNEDLEKVHASVAGGGDTEAPNAEDNVDLHYVCLTRAGNQLVELDGRRKGPIVRGNLDGKDILGPESIAVIREFMDREANSHSFSIIALVEAN